MSLVGLDMRHRSQKLIAGLAGAAALFGGYGYGTLEKRGERDHQNTARLAIAVERAEIAHYLRYSRYTDSWDALRPYLEYEEEDARGRYEMQLRITPGGQAYRAHSKTAMNGILYETRAWAHFHSRSCDEDCAPGFPDGDPTPEFDVGN